MFGTIDDSGEKVKILNGLARQMGLPESSEWPFSLEWMDPKNIVDPAIRWRELQTRVSNKIDNAVPKENSKA